MQETNLKISPYFDDFDSSKNYHKVLFKPGYSVQTRELNTLQSTLQDQIEKFGQHVFKDGSLVIPGNVNYDLTAKAVLIQPLINGVNVENNLSALIGKTLTGSSSGVKASVTGVLTQEESEKDTTTLYVSYNYGGIEENGVQLKEFKNNEVLLDKDENPVAVTTVQNATAYTGSTVNINSGVYFVRGFFVEVLSQKIILDQYSVKPTYKVGLQIIESVVTADEDSSLYDNSLGTTNYASPGADRLKIELKLVKQNILVTENSNFIELLRFENGKITQQADAYQSAYSQLEKNLARRTYSNHGSFTTQPYTIKIREALNDGTNNGVYNVNEISYDGRTIVNEIPAGVSTTNIGSNEYTDGTTKYILGQDYYAIELSEGKAYVEGFEVLNERKQYTLVPKPRKTQFLNNQGAVLQIGSYIKTSAVTGSAAFGTNLLLKDVDDTEIGIAKLIGVVKNRLYVAEVSVYENLYVDEVTGLSNGNFVRGSVSGATGFIESVTISGSDKIVKLRQVTGSFVSTDKFESSSGTIISVSNVTRGKLENVRTLSATGFLATVHLDSISLTGSSFTVDSTGTSLTGVNTAFNFELSAKSKVKLGSEAAVEVTSITDGTTVTLTSAVAEGTYYSASKQVCRLYSSPSGLTTRVSLNPIKSASDYVHSRLISETKSVSGTSTTIQASLGNVIDADSILITNSSGIVTTAVINQSETNSVQISNLTEDTYNIFYRLRVANPTTRVKERQEFKFLSVQGTTGAYGTKYVDVDISLKFPDVIKIHAIHESVNSSESSSDLFDSLVLNDTTSINLGDMIVLGSIRAKVISKNSNTVYVKYITNTKFQKGTNLAISVTVPTNNNAADIFIKESYYGKYRDITDDFKFVRNDSTDFYKVSKLVRKSSAAVPQNKFVVVFDYFQHTSTSNDFYSKDSYDEERYEDIPLAFNYVSMSDMVDFRYYISPSTLSNAGSVTDPYVESDSSFDIYGLSSSRLPSGQKVPYPGSILGLDYSFYMGRVDKVYLTASNQKYGYITGQLRVVQGADSIDPALADDAGAGLLLATIKLPPYLKDVSQSEITMEKTRNYTMKDIGKLEDRISAVEKYTSLSLLEVSTNNLNILDEDGKNRFKNGFVVDSFTTTDVADLANPDYSASIDLDKNIVRPYPAVNNTGFYYSASESSAKFNRSYVTIPYEETPLVSQTYSSRVENLFPYEVFSWVGNMDVFPKKDIWYDTQREIVEGQNINLVDSYVALFDLVVPGGQIWGDWQLGAGGAVSGGGGTTITDIAEGTQFDVTGLNFELESGDTIQNIIDVKYSRSRIVNINTTLLRPNTRFYFYVNDVESNDIIYPKLLRNLSNRVGSFVVGEKVDLYPIYSDDLVRTALPISRLSATVYAPSRFTDEFNNLTDQFGSNLYPDSSTILAIDDLRSADNSDIDPTIIGTNFYIIGRTSGAYAKSTKQQPLYSDEFGNLNAFVLIPPTKFETGDLTFSVSDVPGNLQVKGITASYAIGQYYTQGTELSVTSNVTTLEVPELTATAITRERTRFIPDPPPAPAGHDPIAQSFFIGEEGVFVTSIDLYFLTKDETQPVTIDIRTMENGTPTGYIVPGSIVTVPSKAVKVSTNASESTRFTFDNPIFLSSNTSYSFIVRTTNKNYNLWVSRLGETDVTTGLFIDKQPYVGVLYKSSNQSIWTPDQYEDVKFILNRAQFETNTTFTAVLPNTPVVEQKLNNNPFKFVQGSSTIKVFQPNHGMHQVGNKVTISGASSDILNGTLSSPISGDATTIPIADILGSGSFDGTSEGWAKIDNKPISSSNPGYVKINDEIIAYGQVTAGQLTQCVRGQFSTQAVSHESGSVIQCFQLNGIILNSINNTHTISKVINMDEYEIIVDNVANITKQCGANVATATRNIQYETITPNFNIFSPTNTETSISIVTTSGTSIGNTTQESFLVRSVESIDNHVENRMNEPKLVLSTANAAAFQSGSTGSLKTYVNMSTTSDMVSPVLDLAGSSMTTISNRINKEVDDQGNIDITSELTPTGGKHSAYITKKVVLETSSTSVKVLFDGIRTEKNDFKVFVKVKGDSTPGSFDDMNYEEIPAISYPVSKNNKEFRAFDFEIKSLREFQEFSVKIVMIGNDQSDCPKIRNLRALALAL